MTGPSAADDGFDDRDATSLILERTFDAPRERVWDAWTDPERVAEWWGPRGYTMPHCEIDLREGGRFHYCMRSPGGEAYWSRGVYREVVEPERLVYVDSFADADGAVVEPTEYGMGEDFPTEALVTVTFEAVDGGTRLTLRHDVGAASEAERDGMHTGWTESFDRLETAVDGDDGANDGSGDGLATNDAADDATGVSE